jgi:hypothetical protein
MVKVLCSVLTSTLSISLKRISYFFFEEVLLSSSMAPDFGVLGVLSIISQTNCFLPKKILVETLTPLNFKFPILRFVVGISEGLEESLSRTLF